MSNSSPKVESLARLHVFSHLSWQREGVQRYEIQRAQLLDAISDILQHLEARSTSGTQEIAGTILGGQTIILEDIAAVRPGLLTLLVIYHSSGRLGFGPWYVQADGVLVSGESLVRNLLYGRRDLDLRGLKPLSVVYMPDTRHLSAGLPQILRGFGYDAALLCVDETSVPLPFIWSGADGSEILVSSYQPASSPAEAVDQQRYSQPDGPFLWLQPEMSVHDDMLQAGVPVTYGALSTYLDAIRAALPDEMRPRLNGELMLPDTLPDTGRYSARMPLKQRHAALQARLTYETERLLALALTHGRLPHADNARAMLEYGWRLLMQNQAVSTISGACSDSVSAEIENRSQHIEDVTDAVTNRAMQALTAPVGSAGAPENVLYVAVWNPHGYAAARVIEQKLTLPVGYYPAVVRAPDGAERIFGWDEEAAIISFYADVPSLGYAVYTVQLSEQSVPHTSLKQVASGTAIASTAGDTLTLSEGQLHWKRGDYTLHNVLTYVDGGDAGTARRYREPQPDVLVEAVLTDNIHVESCPTYERLVFRHRMRVAPSLVGGGRSRGLKVLDLITEATFYENMPGLYLRVKISNTAEDHRLRAYIRTGITADHVLTDTAFALVQHPLSQNDAATRAMHDVCAVHDEDTLFALFASGLPEFEPLLEDGQVTLALTLLRAVGRLDAAVPQKFPGAQLEGNHTAEWMLMELNAADRDGLLRRAQMYRAPLLTRQLDALPATMTRTFLNVSPEPIVLTALKPPENKDGWIVRVLNPTDEPLTAHIEPQAKIAAAHRVTLAETAPEKLTVTNGVILVDLAPHQLATVHLEFDDA